MKRKVELCKITINNTKYNISPIYPILFWHYCDDCHNEFKKEWGWKIEVIWNNKKSAYGSSIHSSNEVDSYYLCSECCLEKSDVEKYYNDYISDLYY